MSARGFFWFDLLTSDVADAKAFYGALTGWTTTPFMDGAYNVLEAAGEGIGGLMSNAPQAPGAPTSPPMWMGYAHVEDVDASTGRVEELGGKVLAPPQDIPSVGRFSVITDPQGALLALFKPTPPPGATHEPRMSRDIGHCCWTELFTSDRKGAQRFYRELLGWRVVQEMEMEGAETYAIFAFEAHGEPMGGMMNVPGKAPTWCFYFTVENVDEAVKTIIARGGKVTSGPMDVPGGSRVAQCTDPQGVAFGISSRAS